ncbi:MAG: hypothetical protein KF901_09920 [Myxococcales bacterium]|nr:hypothetical protein [Myxococcales bacterium]
MTFSWRYSIVWALLALALLGPDAPASAQRAERAIERWRDGAPVGAGQPGDWAIDLGEAWVPRIFDGGAGPDGSMRPHHFRETYVALARHEWPEGPLGERAAQDVDLDNFGIPPALSVLRRRLRALADAPCADEHDAEALERFAGVVVDEDEPYAPRMARDDALEGRVVEALARDDRFGLEGLETARRSLTDERALARALPELYWRRGLDATRRRLHCEGHYGDEPPPTGRNLDARTRRALESFERRHRIYSRGNLSGETLRTLRVPPKELARRDLVRVLAERLRLGLGVIEDGSAPGSRDLEAELRAHVERAFGLTSFDRALAFLERLPLDRVEHHLLAIEPAALPPWYGAGGELALDVEIDRGDQWYEPPFDERGEPRNLPVENRPTITLFVTWEGERVPLVQWPTTVGSWSQEQRGRQISWQYKESPAGEFAWPVVVGAPVWLPPATMPARDLVTQRRVDETGHLVTETRSTLLGPGYASAFGLVAAIHRPVLRQNGDRVVLGSDQGIRTHGSVDYTSVWRRASRGCHRLHNHRAVALFNFVVTHRAHRRLGHPRIDYRRSVEVDGETFRFDLQHGGYVFQLERPVLVRVLPGRILGNVPRAPARGIPIVVDDPQAGPPS